MRAHPPPTKHYQGLPAPGLPQGRAPLQGAACPCLPFMHKASLGSAAGRRRRRTEAGGETRQPAWLEESPNQLKIVREIIPTPSQNRKLLPRPTTGQPGEGFEERWPRATPPPSRKTTHSRLCPRRVSEELAMRARVGWLAVRSGAGGAQEEQGP